MTTSKDQNEDSAPLYKLFLEDLKEQSGRLLHNLLALKSTPDDKLSFERALSIIYEIRGGAKITKLHLIEMLAESLAQNSLAKYKIGAKPPLEEESLTLLFQGQEMLARLGKAAPNELLDFIISEKGSIDQLIEKCQKSPQAPKVGVLKKNQEEEPSGESLEIIAESDMLDLFKLELEVQLKALNAALISFEESKQPIEDFSGLMRAIHSIKGAAKVVSCKSISSLAHAMEDLFASAQQQNIKIGAKEIDSLFKAVDLLEQLTKVPNTDIPKWLSIERGKFAELTQAMADFVNNILQKKLVMPGQRFKIAEPKDKHVSPEESFPRLQTEAHSSDRVLRLTVQNLNRLMGLAGESMVESRWLNPFSNSLIKLKKSQNELAGVIDTLRDSLHARDLSETAVQAFEMLQNKSNECRQSLSDRLSELETFISRHSSLADRLYTEVIESRMRPFGDIAESFPRMVRDLARQLNKNVRFEILGRSTPVDRDILQKLEVPLSHLLRNAVDHGIESPSDRINAGKPPEGTVRLEARHRAGSLAISVSDDGKGIDFEMLRNEIIKKKLAKADIVAKMTGQELLDFLFLPGFTTTTEVTEISGRGIGLNIVQNMVQELNGSIKVVAENGHGLTFKLYLPLTLSVIRALIAEIGGEPYAFPLSRIDQAVLVPYDKIEMIENCQYFNFEGQNIGIVPAAQVLDLAEYKPTSRTLPVIILSDRYNSYGLAVDNFFGERELVVQELEERLKKVPNILAGSFMEDGQPVLIVDVEDCVRSVDALLSGGRLHKVSFTENEVSEKHTKRILVVDDSITVREVECRLLRNNGYEVETAVNGMDGWNAVRIGHYDLVVTDVDMPRMNGIELVKAIKADPRLKSLPVMIVSYKERESDRLQGLEAGANYYLTKSSFHDETLLNAVIDLIGKP